jgi:hypothetical protein
MTTATKNRQKTNKADPVMPSRDQIIGLVRRLGGESEVKRYEAVEKLERAYNKGSVFHRWKVGNLLGPSFRDRDDDVIRVYALGLGCVPQTLRLSVRLTELYDEPELRKLLSDAAAAGHELNWAHFRQLMREGLTDVQRTDLVARITKNHWGYRELQTMIDAIVGGKKSQGGRKPGKTQYKTYIQALGAMKLRSKAWLALEEDWISQVKALVSKLDEGEKFTPEFLALTTSAAQQLRDVSNKAQVDAEEAEAIAAEVAKAMSPESQLKAAVRTVAKSAKEALSTSKAKGKPSAKPRLAKHPKMVDGKVVSV